MGLIKWQEPCALACFEAGHGVPSLSTHPPSPTRRLGTGLRQPNDQLRGRLQILQFSRASNRRKPCFLLLLGADFGNLWPIRLPVETRATVHQRKLCCLMTWTCARLCSWARSFIRPESAPPSAPSSAASIVCGPVQLEWGSLSLPSLLWATESRPR